jgi:hypothetical protein
MGQEIEIRARITLNIKYHVIQPACHTPLSKPYREPIPITEKRYLIRTSREISDRLWWCCRVCVWAREIEIRLET